MSGRKGINLLVSGGNSLSDSRLAANVTVRRRGRPRRGASGAMSTQSSGGRAYNVRVTPEQGHGVSGHPVTGGMGSYNAYYNTTNTPAQRDISTQSDFNAFPNTAVAAPNTLLEQIVGDENYSPLRPVALNFNDNDFTGQPRQGAPAVLDPTGDYVRSMRQRRDPFGDRYGLPTATRLDPTGDYMSNMQQQLGWGMANQEAHDVFTLHEEEAWGGGAGALMATPHELRQHETHQSGTVNASYQGQRVGDGLHSGDPTISHYITGLGGGATPLATPLYHHVIDIGNDPDHHVIDIGEIGHPDHHVIDMFEPDDDVTPVQQYIQPEDPLHTTHQTSQINTNIRHGQENGTTNDVSQIADQVHTPQGNNWQQQTSGMNQPMAPVTNNSGTGTHPSMVGPSGAPMPSSADEAYRIMIQGEPSLLDLAPAADIPVMPGQPTILGVKTAWANPGFNQRVGPVYA